MQQGMLRNVPPRHQWAPSLIQRWVMPSKYWFPGGATLFSEIEGAEVQGLSQIAVATRPVSSVADQSHSQELKMIG